MKRKFFFLLIALVILALGTVFLYTKTNTIEVSNKETAEALFFGDLSSSTPEIPTDPALLTFTNTQTWDPKLLRIASETPYYVGDSEKIISLPLPPANTSPETKKELEVLLSYKALREAHKKDILEQADFATIKFDGRLFTDYLDDKKFPLTAAVFEKSFDDITTLTFRIKQKFNRVRPSFLEPNIAPMIDIPDHPAYPSGHSTQMHFAALVLGELEPKKKAVLWTEADAIAKNREIAGLHYPSDSAAGVSLAQQFFKYLMQKEEFKNLLLGAKSEWK